MVEDRPAPSIEDKFRLSIEMVCSIYATDNCPDVFGKPINTIKDLSILKRLPVQLQNLIRDKVQVIYEQQEDFQDSELITAEIEGRKPYIVKAEEKMPAIGRSEDFHINFPEIIKHEEEMLQAEQDGLVEFQW